MKPHLLVLVLLLGFRTVADAGRYSHIPSNAEKAAESEWIFVGRVQRYQHFPPPYIGVADTQYIVRVIRSLRGTQPGFVVVRGSATVPLTDGQRDFIFFANRPNPPLPGIHGVTSFGGIRSLTELREVQQLITTKASNK